MIYKVMSLLLFIIIIIIVKLIAVLRLHLHALTHNN